MSQSLEFSELIADVKEQVLYFQELGVETLAIEMPKPVDSNLKSEIQKQTVSGVPAPLRMIQGKSTQSQSPGSRLSSLPSLSGRTAPINARPDIQRMEININAKPVPAADETLFGDTRPMLPESGETIESIRAEIGNCTRCPLYAGRKQIVHSAGNFSADLMFVGEAPGADEDEQGFPFVGRAGQLLTKIIESIGMQRDEVFIGNINRCRPPGNRAPEPIETAACRPYLMREVAVIKPKVIVVLGATAAHNLLQTKTPIGKLRGNFQEYLGVKVMPTFHPAYLLRDPHKKREVWEDMKKVRAFLHQ
ncbi:MAG: uracil-DNA glycosylase [Pyrinomonadaceae bacterium]